MSRRNKKRGTADEDNSGNVGRPVKKSKARHQRQSEEQEYTSALGAGLQHAVDALDSDDRTPFLAKLHQIGGYLVQTAVQHGVLGGLVQGVSTEKFQEAITQEVESYAPDSGSVISCRLHNADKLEGDAGILKYLIAESTILPCAVLESDAMGTLLAAWAVCCHNGVHAAKVQNYLAYGKALLDSNVNRQDMFLRILAVPDEVQLAIFAALARSSIGKAAAFPNNCRERIGTLAIPFYIEKTNSVETAGRIMLQALGHVKLVTPSHQRQASSQLHPGFEVDATHLQQFQSFVHEDIATAVTIINSGDFATPNDPSRLPVPTGLVPPALSHLKRLVLKIDLPYSRTDIYPSALYRAQAKIQFLASRLTSLKGVRLIVHEHNKDDLHTGVSGTPRRQYVTQGWDRSKKTTLLQILQGVVVAFRRLNVPSRSVIYLNEDGKDDDISLKLSECAEEMVGVQVLEKTDEEVVEDLVASQGIEFFI